MFKRAIIFCFFCFQFVWGELNRNTIPDVHFSIIRLDFLSFEIKNHCELTQPYRKSLPGEYYVQVGNLYVGGSDDYEYTMNTIEETRLTLRGYACYCVRIP